MSKEVAKKESTEVSTEIALDAFGDTQVSSQDIIIPKILAMQPGSKLVTDGKAVFGDFVDSLSGTKIGSIKEPIQFIPFHMEKIMIISKKEAGEYKFDRIEPVTAANESLPYEHAVGEFQYKNEQVMNFYSLLPSDMSMPYIIAFKGMSRKSGRALATQMFIKNRSAGKVPPAKIMELTGEKVQNNKGTFVTLGTSIAGDSSNEQIGECLKWFKTIQSGAAKAHEEVATKPAYEEENTQF